MKVNYCSFGIAISVLAYTSLQSALGKSLQNCVFTMKSSQYIYTFFIADSCMLCKQVSALHLKTFLSLPFFQLKGLLKKSGAFSEQELREESYKDREWGRHARQNLRRNKYM